MAVKIPVTTDPAQVIFAGEKGAGVLIVNEENVSDVYISAEAAELNTTKASGTPSGTKVAKNGGQVQFTAYAGKVYARADGATGDTFIRVIPS